MTTKVAMYISTMYGSLSRNGNIIPKQCDQMLELKVTQIFQ